LLTPHIFERKTTGHKKKMQQTQRKKMPHITDHKQQGQQPMIEQLPAPK
jgi:hypothetical protein